MTKRKQNQVSWIVFGPEQLEQAVSLVSTANTYRQIVGTDLPEAVPEDFRRKSVKAVALRSDSTSGFTLVTNFVRYDPKKMALDEQPFIIFVLPGNAAQLSSGALIHHGNWSGRTTPADPTLVAAVGSAFVGTNVATLHSLATDPLHEVGPIEELKGTSHGHAFEVIFRKLTEK